MNSITLKAGTLQVDSSVQLPLSKSISNRVLMMNTLSGGSVKYDQLSDADDTILMKELLEQIRDGSDKRLNAKNAGTVFRFLTPYLSITPGTWILDGDKRMRQRPVSPLVEALQFLGADISYAVNDGFPPVIIEGKPLKGGMLGIDASQSSQFVSAMLMIAPLLPEGLAVYIYGTPGSLPYINMTIQLMQEAGITIDADLPAVDIKHSNYKEVHIKQEADWSAAAYWYELIALSKGGRLLLKGLHQDSIQGDSIVAEYFKLLGVETRYKEEGVEIIKSGKHEYSITLDLGHCPDLAPPLLVTAAALGIEANFSGLKNLQHKESNRLKSISDELLKMGIHSLTSCDTFSIQAQEIQSDRPVDTYKDHRIAMAFAPLAILGQAITINDPEVVSKSYPGFWEEINKVMNTDR